MLNAVTVHTSIHIRYLWVQQAFFINLAANCSMENLNTISNQIKIQKKKKIIISALKKYEQSEAGIHKRDT